VAIFIYANLKIKVIA